MLTLQLSSVPPPPPPGEEVVSLEVAGLRVEEGGVSVDFELTVSNVSLSVGIGGLTGGWQEACMA